MVRSLENFPEHATLMMAFLAQASGVGIQRGELPVGARVVGQVREMPKAIAVVNKVSGSDRKCPALAAEVIGEDQVQRRARLRFVRVMPVRIVPAALSATCWAVSPK
jgi:hypothetical protein